MRTIDNILRTIGYIGMAVGMAWVITWLQHDALFWTSASMMMFGVFYNPLSQWHSRRLTPMYFHIIVSIMQLILTGIISMIYFSGIAECPTC